MRYPEKVAIDIEGFIQRRTLKFHGGVIGLSGGIDSTVVAHLAVKAIGASKVLGLIMPYSAPYKYRPSYSINTNDAIRTAQILGITYKVIDIKPIVEGFEKATIDFTDKSVKGNLMARVRMCLLYGYANWKNLLVLGTSNKSEYETGYLTKYGDGGVDIEPIGNLYKTHVFELAKYLKIDEKIIAKKPSADLWDGQTDEEDLGIDYTTLDRILSGETMGISEDDIRKVERLIEISKHKRCMPEAANT